MIKVRTWVLLALLASPLAAYVIVGAYALWATHWIRWVWWWLPVCWTSAWFVSKLWPAGATHSTPHPAPTPTSWTPRDQQAMSIVVRYQQRVDELTWPQLTDPHQFWDTMRAMAGDLARHYHPDADDPLGALTVPEILAAIRLAVTDMERWVLTSAPGSRLLTLKQWQALRHAPTWLRRLKQMSWATSILLNPSNIGLYVSSKLTAEPITAEMQQELLMLFYARFTGQIGYYLIEMNSGRLRAGADAYLQAFPAQRAARSPSSSTVRSITVALVGQVSAGKSSLINALLNTPTVAVDTLPCTREVSRHQAPLAGSDLQLILLDTPGYGESGAQPEQLAQIEQALRSADAVLLVMDAHVPARRADDTTLAELRQWYEQQPQLKPPPVLGVLTHVDLLPPALVWSPPYDWQTPTDRKSEQIHAAVDYAKELLGDQLRAVVPVCCDQRAERQWGIDDQLRPALVQVLDDAHAVAILRAYEQQMDQRRFRTLLQQLKCAGRSLVQCWIDERLGARPN